MLGGPCCRCYHWSSSFTLVGLCLRPWWLCSGARRAPQSQCYGLPFSSKHPGGEFFFPFVLFSSSFLSFFPVANLSFFDPGSSGNDDDDDGSDEEDSEDTFSYQPRKRQHHWLPAVKSHRHMTHIFLSFCCFHCFLFLLADIWIQFEAKGCTEEHLFTFKLLIGTST